MNPSVYNLPNECVIILFGGTDDRPGLGFIPGVGIVPIPGWDPDGWREVSAYLAAATFLEERMPNIASAGMRERVGEFVHSLQQAAVEKVDGIVAAKR